jgi:hypothetical protein
MGLELPVQLQVTGMCALNTPSMKGKLTRSLRCKARRKHDSMVPKRPPPTGHKTRTFCVRKDNKPQKASQKDVVGEVRAVLEVTGSKSTRSQVTPLNGRKSWSTNSITSSAGTLMHSASYRRRISLTCDLGPVAPEQERSAEETECS